MFPVKNVRGVLVASWYTFPAPPHLSSISGKETAWYKIVFFLSDPFDKLKRYQ